jgi:hypothetical protein
VAVARASGVSDGFAELFFFGAGESEPDWPFPGVVFFFFFPFGELSFAADFFGFGCAVGSGVSLGFGDTSFVEDFLAFGFDAASGVSPGVGDASESSAEAFLAFAFFFGDGDADAAFFFLAGETLDFGARVGDFSLDDESTARAFRIGLPSSVC